MAMEIIGGYSGYAAQGMAGNGIAGSAQKKGARIAEEPSGNSNPKNMAEYADELAKLAPSVEFRVGTAFSSAKSGKTLTVNPRLLEEMQNSPEKEKEMKELIKGVESAVNRLDNVMNASGWSVVFKHDYIDENGKYRQIALVRNGFMLNMSDRLREDSSKGGMPIAAKL